MSKELEALKRMEYFVNEEMGIKTFKQSGWHIEGTDDYEMVKEALQRLESIDNANPSEALECLEEIENYCEWSEFNSCLSHDFPKEYNTIKQALIKAQENEKENVYIEKIKTMMKQKDCVLRYIESEDCFAVKTILSDGWYKLTPDFVNDNVREEIKPLPLIEKNKQLREENAQYKRVLDKIKEQEKVLEIIKKKPIESGIAINYYIKQQLENNIVVDYKQYKKTIFDLSQIYLLTQEEFELLKRWL